MKLAVALAVLPAAAAFVGAAIALAVSAGIRRRRRRSYRSASDVELKDVGGDAAAELVARVKRSN